MNITSCGSFIYWLSSVPVSNCCLSPTAAASSWKKLCTCLQCRIYSYYYTNFIDYIVSWKSKRKNEKLLPSATRTNCLPKLLKHTKCHYSASSSCCCCFILLVLLLVEPFLFFCLALFLSPALFRFLCFYCVCVGFFFDYLVFIIFGKIYDSLPPESWASGLVSRVWPCHVLHSTWECVSCFHTHTHTHTIVCAFV